MMSTNSIFPENTRLRRQPNVQNDASNAVYDILQASTVEGVNIWQDTSRLPPNTKIRLVRGDHREELQRICQNLQNAQKYAANHSQREMLQKIQESFRTGDLEVYRQSQKIWVQDKAPTVETVIGFVEPYRDPLGVRGEFEGIVGIADPVETRTLKSLADIANEIIPRLPWTQGHRENNGKGPFEKELFDPPDFASVQSKSSNYFPGNILMLPRPCVLLEYCVPWNQSPECGLPIVATGAVYILTESSTMIYGKKSGTKILYLPIV